MKKTYYIIAALCLTLCAACANDAEKIAQSAQGYLNAMGNYRPSEARPFATEETCNTTLEFYEHILKNTNPQVYANNMPAEITLGEISINDTLATVAFHKSTPSTQQDGSLNLVKRKGKWLAHEIIKVPAALNPNTEKNRKITEEEIAEMRRNGSHSEDEFQLKGQE